MSGRTPKRLVICADGTWKDATQTKNKNRYTNIARIAQCIVPKLEEGQIQQVIYLPGVGSDSGIARRVIDGALGKGMSARVREGYDWLALNYVPGDEIYLIGFSRGAYIVRMINNLIGLIGIFTLSQFPELPELLQLLLKDPTGARRSKALQRLLKDRGPKRQKQLSLISSPYLVKSIAVFETVGARGLPASLKSKKTRQVQITYDIYGQEDFILGPWVESGFQAMGLDEPRPDYRLIKFSRLPEMKEQGQILEQCWFSGGHSDVGGGYEIHDLPIVSLFWMVSKLQKTGLVFDTRALKTIGMNARYPWGTCHTQVNPRDLGHSIARIVPTNNFSLTCERYHMSVLKQPNLRKDVQLAILNQPDLVVALEPFEIEMMAACFPEHSA